MKSLPVSILVKNGNITNIEAFNADTIYLPEVRLGEPVFIDKEESDE